ncbi:MAG: carboxypeptidase-like regulatory domain-containing protein [Gemmatimonadetes bacterium]|nr:carboxypeptidase-like regulatory domain-containing protein [Gemmatimonadota bacterium]
MSIVLITACGLTPEEYEAIDAWLHCTECIDGERARVDSIGERAVPTIARALIGPSDGRIRIMRQKLEADYQSFGNTALTADQYIDSVMLRNFVATYQKRAAISLGDVGGDRAQRALQAALDSGTQRGYRTDVIAVITAVHAGFGKPEFTGVVSAIGVRFNDTVKVREGGQAWDGDETVVLNGAPFPRDLVVNRWEDSLSFVAVGGAGTYLLSITGLGSPTDTQVAPLDIVSVRYEAHPAATAPLVTPPASLHLALPTRPGDSTDYFKFQPPAQLNVTATVESPGLEAPSLAWFECGPQGLAPVGPPGTLGGVVVNETGTPASGAEVRIAGTAVGVVTDGLGRFSFVSPSSGLGLVGVRVSSLGYRTSEYRLQVGEGAARVALVPGNATEATGRTLRVSGVSVPAGECWLLQVGVRSGGAVRIIRLQVTSP